jgi:hypothetical protein
MNTKIIHLLWNSSMLWHIKFVSIILMDVSQDSVVGITSSYWLDNKEVRLQVLVGSTIFSPAHHPDRLWGSPNLLSNGYWG